MRLVLCLILGITLLAATSAMALYTEAWEMDVDMTSAGAGAIAGTAMHADGGGSGTYGQDGFNYEDGIATFLDDASSSSNQGVEIHGAQAEALLGTAGYTVDMRIRWLQGTDGNGQEKSMGFAGIGGVGRGLEIDSGWIYSVSSGDVAAGGIDMTPWNDLRIVVQSSGLWSVYRMGTWDLVLASPTAGNTPTADPLSYELGFFLGSMGGSSTTLCNYELDWVRVAQGTVVDADHNPAPPITPEPGSMLALACGLVGMAGFAIRRRRA